MPGKTTVWYKKKKRTTVVEVLVHQLRILYIKYQYHEHPPGDQQLYCRKTSLETRIE